MTTKDASADKGLDKLLGHLERKADDDLARYTFGGKALSKSEKNLHLAVADGIVAIPLANIEQVVQVDGISPDLVWVAVRNVGSVRYLLQTNQLPDQIDQLSETLLASGMGQAIGAKSTMWGWSAGGTATRSGCPPAGDACDDWGWHRGPNGY
jgi:hypothetical protein